MNNFEYKNNELYADEVPVRELAEQYGTPLYIYSKNHLQTQYQGLADSMAEVNPLICYSVKANSNAAVIKTFTEMGSGLDIVSGGELFRAIRAGADPQKIVFAGVGKTEDEIKYALKENILFFTVESEPEAERISDCACELGVTGRIAFRINPDVDPQTHKYVSTGKMENKFGLDLERAVKAYEMAADLPNIEIAGIHMHIGSQLLSAKPFEEALVKVKELCLDLKEKYPTFKYIDIGGGIGIKYESGQEPLMPDNYARHVIPILKELELSVVLEPGRNLSGNAGILVCKVQYIKDNPIKKFVVIDGAMNDLIRPSLYQSHHDILAVSETASTITGDLVGPICESGDFLASNRNLPAVSEGDYIAVMSAGAYGFTMSSNYNSRPRAAEVMVDKNQSYVIRERETYEDLVVKETL
ncbi:diaminopimelate decarboxylase [bacterium E08(2017)]|nr:diaminopimelate decarboxylase [bacterium E08(2017)]